jgi:hypothetical protein
MSDGLMIVAAQKKAAGPVKTLRLSNSCSGSA